MAITITSDRTIVNTTGAGVLSYDSFSLVNEDMIIQPYSSRFETPRVQLSREAYENSGIEIFSSEKIPFANRTSPEFAQNLVNLFTARVKNLQRSGQSFPNGLHIYELGAGTGILAKRILDLLKNEHKDIYEEAILHFSDFSKPMVSQLRSSDVFKNHKDHIAFEIIDATNPKFIHKPLLVYFTNLIDSIPYQRHILIKDGQIFEIQIQTSIKKDAQIVDATSYPPKVIEEKEIAGLFSSSDIKRRLVLAPQILTVLEEKPKFVPIADVANIGKKEREDLKNLQNFLHKDKPFAFNYSCEVRMAIRKIINELDKGGFIFFSDFGITSKEYKQVLHIECGLLIFFSVDFPSLVQVAEMAGGKTYLTSNTPGFPQEMLIDTIQSDTKMESLFKKESVGDLQERVTDFLENAKTIISKSGSITARYSSLPKEVKHDYLLLNSLAFFLLQAKFYQEADFYADLLLEKYGHSVGVYYYLVKGKTAQEQGELKVAEEFFKEAAEKKGFLAWAYLAELYWQQKRYLQCIDAIKQYLKYTRMGDYLKSMLSIATAQEKLYGGETARKTLKSLISIGRKLKTLSEPEKEILKQAESHLAFS